MWEPRRLTTLWAFTSRHRDSFTFTVRISKPALINIYDENSKVVPVRMLVRNIGICDPDCGRFPALRNVRFAQGLPWSACCTRTVHCWRADHCVKRRVSKCNELRAASVPCEGQPLPPPPPKPRLCHPVFIKPWILTTAGA